MALGTLAKHHHNYPAHPIAVSGTCKTEKADHHTDLLKILSDACNDKASVISGPIYCLASDGKSHWGKALIQLMEQKELSSSSALYPMLGSLPLLNQLVGENKLTSDKDYKHCFKRF